jgi:hypothetical protein
VIAYIDNTNQVRINNERKASMFLRIFMDRVEKYSDPITPKRFGNLRRDKLKQVLGLQGKMKWGKNYAMWQEIKQYQHYTTPGTGRYYASKGIVKAVDDTKELLGKVGISE